MFTLSQNWSYWLYFELPVQEGEEDISIVTFLSLYYDDWEVSGAKSVVYLGDGHSISNIQDDPCSVMCGPGGGKGNVVSWYSNSSP